MSEKQWSDVELLKWMSTASPNAIFEKAKTCANVNQAVVMCEHALLDLDFKDPLEARIRLLKARLFESLPGADVANEYERAVDAGKDSLPKNDPELQAAIKRLNELRPPDPDLTLVDNLYDRLLRHLKPKKGVPYEELERRLVEHSDAGWKVLHLFYRLDGDVNNGGFAQYFANYGDSFRDETIESIRLLNSKTAKIVERAFAINDENATKHAKSHTAKKGKLKKYDIVTAEDAPGYYDGVFEDYEEVEADYLNAVGDSFFKWLARYVRKNQSQFASLPKLT